VVACEWLADLPTSVNGPIQGSQRARRCAVVAETGATDRQTEVLPKRSNYPWRMASHMQWRDASSAMGFRLRLASRAPPFTNQPFGSTDVWEPVNILVVRITTVGFVALMSGPPIVPLSLAQ
jgi:hypothetical protein